MTSRGPVQKVASSSSSQHARKPSPLRQSFRMTEEGLVEEVSPKAEIASESEFHLSLQYKNLYRLILAEVKINMEHCSHYEHKQKLMELIPSFALVVPLVASILVTINASYKNVGLAIAAGVVGASATCLIGLLNGLKNSFKYAETAQFYHDRAAKLKEIQDHLSFAINLRQFESVDFYEYSTRFELLKGLPVGSDITGTSTVAADADAASEFLRTNANTTPISSIPKALETKILQTHYASAGFTSSIHTNASSVSPSCSSIRSQQSIRSKVAEALASQRSSNSAEEENQPMPSTFTMSSYLHSAGIIRPAPINHSEQ